MRPPTPPLPRSAGASPEARAVAVLSAVSVDNAEAAEAVISSNLTLMRRAVLVWEEAQAALQRGDALPDGAPSGAATPRSTARESASARLKRYSAHREQQQQQQQQQQQRQQQLPPVDQRGRHRSGEGAPVDRDRAVTLLGGEQAPPPHGRRSSGESASSGQSEVSVEPLLAAVLPGIAWKRRSAFNRRASRESVDSCGGTEDEDADAASLASSLEERLHSSLGARRPSGVSVDNRAVEMSAPGTKSQAWREAARVKPADRTETVNVGLKTTIDLKAAARPQEMQMEHAMRSLHTPMHHAAERPRGMLDPAGAPAGAWAALFAASLAYWVAAAPYRAAFYPDQEPHGVMLWLEFVLDVLLLLDVAVTLRTGIQSGGAGSRVSYDPRAVFRAYARSWLVPTVLLGVPLAWFSPAAGPLGRAPQLQRALRTALVPKAWASVSRTPAFAAAFGRSNDDRNVRLRTLLAMLSASHVLSCVWVLVGREGVPGRSWLTVYDGGIADEPAPLIYLSAMHFAWSTAAGVGYGDVVPVTTNERVLAFFCMAVAATCFAFIIAGMSEMVGAAEAREVRYQQALQSALHMLKHHRADLGLRERVVEYLTVKLRTRRGAGGTDADEDDFDDLSAALAVQLKLQINRGVVESVPFFQTDNPGFIRRVVALLRPALYAPGDIVICEGDLAQQMFFIKSGVVEVCSADGTQVYSRLLAGSFFGEVALCACARRTASVRAVTYSDIFSLSRDDFENVLVDFPSAAVFMQSFATKANYQFEESDLAHDVSRNYSRYFDEITERNRQRVSVISSAHRRRSSRRSCANAPTSARSSLEQ